jgi:predicted small metal-binding protein
VYQFRCRDAEHICGWQATAPTEDELLRKLADHVQKVHGVKTVTNTIVNYAKLKVRQV